MSEQVQIVRLEKQRVAVAWAFSPSPEHDAWGKMEAAAGPAGLLADPQARMFGFNNPNPSPGSPNYGYQFCVTVGPDTPIPDGLQEGAIEGGAYAVVPFSIPEGGDPGEAIPAAWARLDAWVSASAHDRGSQQWLEEHTLQGKIRALYYPLTR